ncbi:Uncharacterized conserved protein YfdQ, DUF2303 family [Albimonas donghaensis]|uniref:Uncharacterized conserved protein YfdQ, DUF2303 family n=1 Tax=Albimonas donghaensis TaxID=356660 RepID=A0A1H3FG27_9RHOB|nr:DUF2303 family protein [Albimonas donghaensis]SDX89916.1 Uncharacterized conserved protein YfdQ, DUF2303 family [Albimonas donghaensis]
MDQERNVIDAAVAHLRKAEIVPIGGEGDVSAIVKPAGVTVQLERMELFRPHPSAIRAEVALETPASFVDYVRDFTVAGRTRVFASLEDRRVHARMDWHGSSGAAGDASWGTHDAYWHAAYTAAFAAWAEVDGRPLTQREFVDFLEDRCADAIEPEPADLMEVALNFDAIRSAKIRSVVNVHTNERRFQFEESDTPAGSVACPKMLTLRTPVFFGTDPVEWRARFAYSVAEGKLTFTVKILRLDDLLEQEFARLVDAVAVDLPDIPVHRGRACNRHQAFNG